jgi:hypothetical protein
LQEEFMPLSKPVTSNQNAILGVLIALGLGVLVLGLYLGFVVHARSLVVLGTLGVSAVLFAIPLALIPKRISHTATATPPTTLRAEPSVAAKVQTKPADIPVPTRPKAAAASPPTAPAIAKPVLTPVVASSVKPDRNADFMELMNTTVGDLLLAAQMKDPEAAGRIVAQAIQQSGKAISASQPPVGAISK